MKSGLRSFLRLSMSDRFLLLEAAFWLTVGWVLVRTVEFRRWSSLLGQNHAETPAVDVRDHDASLLHIKWAIRRMSAALPFHPTCLMEGVAAKIMLNGRHIPSTLYLGVKTIKHEGDPRLEMKAHAWTRCGTNIITGAQGRQDFKVVSTFATLATLAQQDQDTPVMPE